MAVVVCSRPNSVGEKGALWKRRVMRAVMPSLPTVVQSLISRIVISTMIV